MNEKTGEVVTVSAVLSKLASQTSLYQFIGFLVLGITFYNNTNSSIDTLKAKASVLEQRIDAQGEALKQADKEFVVWREKISADINATRVSQARLEAYLMRGQSNNSRIDER